MEIKSFQGPVTSSFSGVEAFVESSMKGTYWSFGNLRKNMRAKGWLWRIEKGWFDLESLRNGFISGATRDYKEFLVLRVNVFISVISEDEPKIASSPNQASPLHHSTVGIQRKYDETEHL